MSKIGKIPLSAALAAASLALVAMCVDAWKEQAGQASAAPAERCILVDAGHGGEDGGATAPDGTLEKDINLSIALDLADWMRVLGYPTQMTRVTDESLSTDGTTIRARKVSDMQNRLTMYNASQFTVSIHQNYFEQSRYSGTQIFCAKDPASVALGEAIRSSVVEGLQPDNTREKKTSTGDIFLLRETTRPAVIVECGFLTNDTEREHLKDATYQRQMAACIAVGICRYIKGE